MDAKQWVEAWESGETVPSIIMGGLSPGYERALQMSAFICARALVDGAFTEADLNDKSKWDDEVIPAMRSALAKNDELYSSLSGAQVGAAMNLACCVYRGGTSAMLTDDLKDRRIRISRDSPPADFGEQHFADDAFDKPAA